MHASDTAALQASKPVGSEARGTLRSEQSLAVALAERLKSSLRSSTSEALLCSACRATGEDP